MVWGSLQLLSPRGFSQLCVSILPVHGLLQFHVFNLLSLPLLCLPSFPFLSSFPPSLPILLASSFYIKSKLLMMIAYFHLSLFSSWVPDCSILFYNSVADVYIDPFTWLLGLHSLYLSLAVCNSAGIFSFHFRMKSLGTTVIAHASSSITWEVKSGR